MKTFDIIVAFGSKDRGIGINGGLPWRLRQDMNFFKTKTTETTDSFKRNCCIMGRTTYFSIPEKFRPLPNRLNIVLSKKNVDSLKKEIESDNVIVMDDLEAAMKLLSTKYNDSIENVYIIGGTQIYEEAMRLHKYCDTLYATIVDGDFQCDTFFPEIDPQHFELLNGASDDIMEENGIKFRFAVYLHKSGNSDSNSNNDNK